MTLEFSGDFVVPGCFCIDRRVAAADEYRTRNSRAIYRQDIIRSLPESDHPRGRVLPLRSGSRARYDVRQQYRRARGLDSIVRVFLHQTGFTAGSDINTKGGDFRRDDHRLDCVIAHFVVRKNGTLLYTHDMQTILNGTGARNDSIEIEFEGNYNNDGNTPLEGERVSWKQLRSGRRLIAWLKSTASGLTNLANIHPHQQWSPGTRPNCPGPDIWINVGEWAVTRYGLNTNAGRRQISDHIDNEAYRISVP